MLAPLYNRRCETCSGALYTLAATAPTAPQLGALRRAPKRPPGCPLHVHEEGVEVLLTGHKHGYERFAPMDVAGYLNMPAA